TILCFSIAYVMGQTFSTSDSFDKKSDALKIKTESFFITFTHQAAGDSSLLSGKVLDKETQSPVAGATIIEKGTRNGTISGSSGEFILQTSTDDPILLVSFSGFTLEEVPVASVTEDKKSN